MNADYLRRVMRATWARSARWALGVMTVLLCSACTWGVQASDIPWSLGPSGAPAEVRLAGSRTLMTAELLAIDSSGVLLQSDRISRVSWTAIRSLSLRGLGPKYTLGGGVPPSSMILQQFALVCHFPTGLEPSVLTKLLATMNQTTVEEIQ